jgi:hypothetical protein
VVGSGHLHRYASKYEGDVLTVWAPSSAFIVKSPSWDFGLNQLGVVEYRIENDEIAAFFRSTPTLEEEAPFSMPSFTNTMALITEAAAAH